MSFVTTEVERGVFVCGSAGNQTEITLFLLRSLIPSSGWIRGTFLEIAAELDLMNMPR